MLGNSSPDRKKPQVRGGETNKQKTNKHRWAKAPKWADTQRESGASKWAGASKRAGTPKERQESPGEEKAPRQANTPKRTGLTPKWMGRSPRLGFRLEKKKKNQNHYFFHFLLLYNHFTHTHTHALPYILILTSLFPPRSSLSFSPSFFPSPFPLVDREYRDAASRRGRSSALMISWSL